MKKKENLDEIKQVIMSKRIKIYKEMKTLVDLEKKLAENLDDTCLKNIISVKPKEVDLKLLHNGFYKCTQCAYAKKPKEPWRHIYDTHGIGGICCMFCSFITPNDQSLYLHCNKQHDTNITGIKFEL